MTPRPATRRVLAVVAALGLIAAACASGPDDDRSDGTSPAPTTEPTASTTTSSSITAGASTPTTERATSAPPPGPCSPGGTIPTGASNHDLAAGGVESSYLLYVPAAVGTEPAPVVLDFHGLGSNGVQQAVVSRYRTLADDEDFLVVNPTGTPAPGSRQNSWELPQLDLDPNRDDIAWVGALIDDLGNHACVDLDRVYATGLSNGGYFSSTLVCRLAERIAATSSVAGVTHPEPCEPSRPVPMLAFHGTADTVVPFDGGDSALLTADSPDTARDFFAQSMPEEFGQFAADFDCSTVADTRLTDEITRTDYTDCEAGVELRFHRVEGDGHTWPGSILMAPFVDTTLDLDATRVSWEFFREWSLPAAD